MAGWRGEIEGEKGERGEMGGRERVQSPDSLVDEAFFQSGCARPQAAEPSPWRQEGEEAVEGMEGVTHNAECYAG